MDRYNTFSDCSNILANTFELVNTFYCLFGFFCFCVYLSSFKYILYFPFTLAKMQYIKHLYIERDSIKSLIFLHSELS